MIGMFECQGFSPSMRTIVRQVKCSDISRTPLSSLRPGRLGLTAD
jgi:hypothetical protein